MGSRLTLDSELRTILGSNNVYFQPPEGFKMHYPCIVYEKSRVNTRYADNRVYQGRNRYSVTVIDPDPDTEIPDKLLTSFMYCRSDRDFVSDTLHHYAFDLYY